MNNVILLHTVQSVLMSFPLTLQNAGQARNMHLRIDNILDEFFAVDSNLKGEFTKANLNRLYLILKAAQLAEPDLIAVTCSTLTPWVEYLRPCFEVPLLTIDDAMCREVAKENSNIVVLATAQSALSPTINRILSESEKFNKNIKVEGKFIPEAMQQLKNNNIDEHNQLILETAKKLRDFDAVVLAQASMSTAENEMKKNNPFKVYSGPSGCVRQILMTLERKNE